METFCGKEWECRKGVGACRVGGAGVVISGEDLVSWSEIWMEALLGE